VEVVLGAAALGAAATAVINFLFYLSYFSKNTTNKRFK